ncbi:Extracellular exo-alpha-(1-_5)-L-arabinofuranosidase precursor [Maioricimonas rarisocia]|uniref:Extracellular exo-alpha-(1->5)-L-arabinofuranosidase n=1 Tax=Maioricimonas rarisocia TaxID=2528026 RepID=A0A517Z4I1_9PLAN|nr:family 43 glycosylhydrolase [Maioricimonas rarisocia]QDU37390.1 Extracellular exo-alpha-(1->5)-L-arabinofuranosidase precursor [Maioricimonas rarisocia]
MKRQWGRGLACLAVLVVLLASSRAKAAEVPPNIITVFIDDMGWSDLSCFGGDVVETEQIDRLAAEGLRFTNFYVNSPICSPSRVALSTGQYPQRWRISSYLANRKRNRQRGMDQWLDPEAPMLARELDAAGYATGHFGKWHMGGQRDVGEAPLITEYGFDESLTNFEGLGPRVLPLKDAYDGKRPGRHDLGSAKLGRGPIRWEDRSVVTAAFVTDAVAFIDEAQEAGRRFYVNLWPDDVHSPFFPPEVLRNETDGSKRALYYAVLDAMDQQLGVLFDRIRNDTALRENTLIVVASDNGPEQGAGTAAPLRGHKTLLYEGGVRSPLIVWGPGLLADDVAGTVNETSVLSALDLNRSFYEITGVEPPEGVELDGENLAATLLGKGKRSREAPIFFRRPPDRPGTKEEPNPDLAARDGKWKFYVNYDGSRPQLYDLSADVSETKNVVEDHPEVAARLKQGVMAWNAGLPKDAGDPTYAESGRVGSLPAGRFVNPIGEGADPWVVRDPNADRYLWCLSEGNRGISIHTSDSLTRLGTKHVVWRAPETGPCSREVWAPELHFLDGRWHVYFAASDGRNENHLAWVLRSQSENPLGPYELHGPLATGEGADRESPNVWAIDMTVLEHAGRRYAVWSGWDAPGTDRQYLYIAAMKSPTELSGRRVRICDNADYLWERVEPGPEHRGLNEAPQVLKREGRTFLLYSCGASWLPTYKLGLLELTGDDPLDPGAWTKHPEPVFAGTEETYGVGHSCFVRSPDGSEWWHVFHAKRDRRPGWRRAVFVQPMEFARDGFPQFGKPVRAGEPLRRPSGETPRDVKLPYRSSLKGDHLPPGWSYYGHHQFIDAARDGLHLGVVPEAPINEYRSGEKVVLDGMLPADLSIEVTIDFRGDGDARDAGILFRCSGSSVGYDAQRGYFAGLIPRTGLVILGRMDGETWTELARAPAEIDANRPQRLQVDVAGEQIDVLVDGERVLSRRDGMLSQGSVGLRVVDAHGVFSDVVMEER